MVSWTVIGTVIALCIVVAIVVPVAVIFTRKNDSKENSTNATEISPTPISLLLKSNLSMEAIKVIDSYVKTQAEQTSVYIGAVTLKNSLNIELSRSHNSSSADYQESMIKTFECILFGTNASVSKASFLSTVVLYATIESELLAQAYINLSHSYDLAEVSASSSTTAAEYGSSCDYLLLSLFGYNTTLSVQSNSSTVLEAYPAHANRIEVTQCLDESFPSTQIDVLLINGIMTSYQEAGMNPPAFQNRVSNIVKNRRGARIRVSFIYNPSEGFFSDFKECLKLKMDEAGRDFSAISTRTLVKVFMLLVRRHPLLIIAGSAVENALIDFVDEHGVWSTFLQRISKSLATFTSTDVLKSIVDSVKNSIMHGRPVIIVGHSQGNLYSNLVYPSLSASERSYVKYLSVATPANYVGAPGVFTPYATRTDDRVINAVRFVSTDTLAGNIDKSSLDIYSNHGFIESYLEDSDANTMIRLYFQQAVESIQFPAITAISGKITVTLTWNTRTDIDLHVHEPSGYHVYYRQKVGQQGYLDVDNTYGYGPENYAVTCGAYGIYSLFVKYFAGSGSTIAAVRVSAGISTKEFSIQLPSQSNAEVPVAKILVFQTSCCLLYTVI